MRHFVESHWGDLVALLLLGLGIALVVFGPQERAQNLGEALAAAALVGLKLRRGPAGSDGDLRPDRRRQRADAPATASPEAT